jgi:CDP-4-dehydro-6-deoxyglucose reductase
VTFQVQVLPQGRAFEAAPRETLLEAALRAGLSPPYRCNNGSCGECRARLVSGRLHNGRPHEFRLRTAEKANGWFLLCCSAPASDLQIETAVAGEAADIAPQRIAARVGKIVPLAADLASLELRTPRSQALRFLAGQHVRLTIPGLPPRSKSIASCPCHATRLEFHLRRVAGDPFAAHVFNALRPGDPVTVEGPWGRFTLRADSRRLAAFLAYETGLAPVKSLIEHAVASEYPGALHLYWVVRAPGGHYLENWCRSLLDALDGFACTLIVGDDGADPDGSPPARRHMLAAARQLLADYPAIAECDVYASGPPAHMTDARQLLLAHGLPAAQLLVDDPPRF